MRVREEMRAGMLVRVVGLVIVVRPRLTRVPIFFMRLVGRARFVASLRGSLRRRAGARKSVRHEIDAHCVRICHRRKDRELHLLEN